MQFERPRKSAITSEFSAQDSFLPETRLRLSILDRTPLQNINDPAKTESAPSKWMKKGGQWMVDGSTVDDTNKININKQKDININTKAKSVTFWDVIHKDKKPQHHRRQLSEDSTASSSSTSSSDDSHDSRITQHSVVPAVPPRFIESPSAYYPAAVQVQRMVRGWWQRLKYRIMYLQHQLDTQEEQTVGALADMLQGMQKRKDKFRAKMTIKSQYDLIEAETGCKAVEAAKQAIAFLKKENKQMREDNDVLLTDIRELKEHNYRLEKAIEETTKHFQALTDQAKLIKDAHDQLQSVIPQYKEHIERLTEAIELRESYIAAEHSVKINYMKVVGKIVENVEERCTKNELVDEVVGFCLAVDSQTVGNEDADVEEQK